MGLIDPLLETQETELKPQISWLGKKYNALLEKYKGKTVQKVVEETKEEVELHNRCYARNGVCSCGGKLVDRIIGTEGIFTNTSTAYHCTNCGNEYERFSTTKSLWLELEKKRIKEVGNEYRYMFWGAGRTFLLLMLILLLLFYFLIWYLNF